MIIYQIKNKQTGKLYIGYSTKFNSNKKFQKSKYWGSGLYIKRAIKEYGKENFERKVLLKNIFDFEELKHYEILWIKKKNSKKPNGYNLTEGGGGIYGMENPFSKEYCEKISIALAGENHSQYGKSGIDTYMYGKHQSQKTRKTLSNFRKGKSWEEIMGQEKAKIAKEKIKKQTTGVNNPNSKLTLEDINEIINSTLSTKELSKIFNVAQCTICRVIKKYHPEGKRKTIQKTKEEIIKNKKEYNKEYYQTHKKELKEKDRKYRTEHRKKRIEYGRQYRKTHEKELKIKKKKYYEEHKMLDKSHKI
jgi:group I intron endonuclease